VRGAEKDVERGSYRYGMVAIHLYLLDNEFYVCHFIERRIIGLAGFVYCYLKQNLVEPLASTVGCSVPSVGPVGGTDARVKRNVEEWGLPFASKLKL
jgi:hypothetical protein